MLMAHQGVETAEFGQWLHDYVMTNGRAEVVHYDQGDPLPDSRHVEAAKGSCGPKVRNPTHVADMDVVVVNPRNEVLFFVEIAERPFSPKKLSGDLLEALLCNGITVRVNGRHKYLSLLPQTKFFFAGALPNRGQELRKIEEVIRRRLAQLQGFPQGLNPANIELIVRDGMDNAIADLKGQVKQVLEA
jgi:hypothetical protein